MAESKVKDGNYYVVQSFMVKDLKLKGLEKDVYAIIYGFSQAENQVFNGSLQYLADWTTSTKQGVIKALKSLQDKGLIVKEDKQFNGVKFCEYYTTEFNTLVNNVEESIKQSLTDGIKQSLTNNKSLDKQLDIIKEIIDYLNSVTDKNFKYTTSENQKHIKARLNDGFTIDDFKSVIDKKFREWKGTEWEKYLRPATLFGTKFESYLNQAETKTAQPKQSIQNELPDSFKQIMKSCTY